MKVRQVTSSLGQKHVSGKGLTRTNFQGDGPRDRGGLFRAAVQPRCVPVKTDDQLDLQNCNRGADLAWSANERCDQFQIRRLFLLEHWALRVYVRDFASLRPSFRTFLAKTRAESVGRPRMIRIMEDLSRGDLASLMRGAYPTHITEEIEVSGGMGSERLPSNCMGPFRHIGPLIEAANWGLSGPLAMGRFAQKGAVGELCRCWISAESRWSDGDSNDSRAHSARGGHTNIYARC